MYYFWTVIDDTFDDLATASGFFVTLMSPHTFQIWQKLICNCAFSGPSVVTGFNVGQILDCPESRSLALSCAQEAGAVARSGR